MYKNLTLVYITTESEEEASRIGKAIVEQKLAACVNIIPGMQSIYRWKGEIEEASETVLIAKTHTSRIKELTKLVKDMHNYECPCIVAFPLSEDKGNSEYLEWLFQESKGAG